MSWNNDSPLVFQSSRSMWSTAMQPLLWKLISGLLLLCVLVQQLGDRAPSMRLKHPKADQSDSKSPPFASTDLETSLPSHVRPWIFDPSRDRNNHGLTTEQCDAAFPKLYHPIDVVTDHWKDIKIDSSNIRIPHGNDGGVRILIHDQQLRIIETRGLHRKDFRQRIGAVVQQIFRSITAAETANEPLPDMEFTIIVDDIPIVNKDPSFALWSFNKNSNNRFHDGIWLIPDFHFFGVPSSAEDFRLMQTRAWKHDAALKDKIPKVVWRGVEWTNKKIRKPLLDATAGKPWADVAAINWEKKSSVIPMDEFCKYRYVVNTEGRAWSARMTLILMCDSLVLMHEPEWIAHYYHLLDTPGTTVKVKPDWSDLEEKIMYYNEHLEEAQQLADRTKELFRDRYTTPAATACYWRKLMRSWSMVSFAPQIIDESKNGTERLRGISFEEFIMHDNTEDYPYKKQRAIA